MIRESVVEKYLCDQVRKIGGSTRKVQWIGRRHAPDRYVMFNGGHWVELKRPGESPRPGQYREHISMRAHGVEVHVLRTLEDVDKFIESITENV